MRPTQELTRQWYDRLAREGFADIETGSDRDGLLKTDKRIDPSKLPEYQAQAAYYRKASSWGYHHRFTSTLDRDIWHLHAEGHAYKAIAAKLRSRGAYVKLVHETVGRLRREMLAARAGGRPEKPEGYHRGSARLNIRLTDQEAEALWYLAALLKVRPVEAARVAIRVCVTTNRGTSVPLQERAHAQAKANGRSEPG